MNIKNIKLPFILGSGESDNRLFKLQEPALLFIVLLLLWILTPGWLHQLDKTAGSVDPSVIMLVLLSLLTFLIVTALSWWLLQHFWLAMGLPTIGYMVLQFNTLKLWQQLGFYWVSFCSVLLAALGCLLAIC